MERMYEMYLKEMIDHNTFPEVVKIAFVSDDIANKLPLTSYCLIYYSKL